MAQGDIEGVQKPYSLVLSSRNPFGLTRGQVYTHQIRTLMLYGDKSELCQMRHFLSRISMLRYKLATKI